MQMKESYVPLNDGVRLFAAQAGDARDSLVVLNGFYLFDDFKRLQNTRTVIALDLRNRGRSDFLPDFSNLTGVKQDVDDIEAARRHFGLETIDLLGHSYAAVIPILYAMKYPDRVRRLVQIGPVQPDPAVRYPEHLMNADQTFREFSPKMIELFTQVRSLPAEEFCRKAWELLRPFSVFDSADADKLRHWEFCGLQTELNFMKYFTEIVQPSLQRIHFSMDELAKVRAPVLIIHGTKDRNAPYGGGRDWANRLPDARLLTVDNAAHAPWIEAPGEVFNALETFLNGAWPGGAEKVESL